MAQQTVKVTGVFEERGAKNGKPWTRTDVKDAGGNKYSTFDEGLARRAQEIKGQTATLTYEEQRNGQYTNLILTGIELAIPEGPWNDVNGATPPSVPTSVNAETIAAPSSKDESIARAVAFKGAIDLASHGVLDADKDGIIAVAEFFEGYLLTGKVAETVRY